MCSSDLDNVVAVCEKEGRDPASLTFSAAMVTCVGSNEEEFLRRAKAIGQDPTQLRENSAGGTTTEVIDRLAAFVETGAQRIYLQMNDLSDLDQLALIAGEVAPALPDGVPAG